MEPVKYKKWISRGAAVVGLISVLVAFQNCSGSGSAINGSLSTSPPPSSSSTGPQIAFSGSGTYTSINPTISFSITDSSGGIKTLIFQLDPAGSPWTVEQQNLPSAPTCHLVNNTCTVSLTFSGLYATPHSLVVSATNNNGVQNSATYNFSIGLSQALQISAANTTATTNANCVGTGGSSTGIAPFYWEIGNASSGSSPIASGSVTLSGQTAVTRATQFEIDSSSKMASGAFLLSQAGVQAWSNSVSPATKTFLHFAAGYTNFQDDSCSVRGLSPASNNVTVAQDTVLDCYTACCIVNSSGNIIKDSVTGGGGLYDLCGNLVNHSNASSMIQSLETSGVISSSDAATGPNVTCNNDYVASTAGSFYYAGGHLQRYAVAANSTLAPNPGDGFSNYGADLTGLIGDKGLTGSTSLATAFLTQFNMSSFSSNFQFAFPQMAGGVYSDAISYAAILQNMLSGSLSNYLTYLGNDSICAYTAQNATAAGYTGVNEDSCSASGYAIYTPITQRLFHYSYTDWVEDDPRYGDGAMSSPGKDGEYPWIDASKTYYGIVHRSNNSGPTINGHSPVGQGYQSLLCGSLVRQAFFTGTAVP